METSSRRWMWGIVVTVAIGVGCANQQTESAERGDDVEVDGDGSGEADTSDPEEDAVEPLEGDPACDSIMTTRCALPWPSNKYLAADSSRETGVSLQFEPSSLPATDSGSRFEVEPYRRMDGYGVGTPILVAFEDLDAGPLPDETAIEASMADDAEILLYRVRDGSLQRTPYWTEVDAGAADDAETKMLIVRPAVILRENTRYIVAMRDLKRQDGSPVESSRAFRRLRRGRVSSEGPLAERRERFEEIFSMLEAEGVSRESLTLAWDFRTASHEALHGTMLEMRERGFEAVGARGPDLEIEEVERFAVEGEGAQLEERPHIGLRIEGTFRVPRYVEQTEIHGESGWTVHRGAEGGPRQNGWKRSPFWMIVPHSAINEAPGEGASTGNGEAHGLVQYGHGLLGRGSQTDSGFNAEIADKHDFIFFGANLFGMAKSDQGTAFNAVTDLAMFQFITDRLHQGMLEYLLLMRAMKRRFPETRVARRYDLQIDAADAHYSGISQGGIFGGTYMALSTDVERGHLGVPGQNYSTLLGRSKNFVPFVKGLRAAYPNRLDQLIGLAAIQVLWGTTDPVSYMHHIKADPFAGTPSHDVLLAPAKGDHQVAVVTNEVTARTDNGIELMSNYPRDVALVEKQSFPYKGSGVVLYDFGTPWPDPGNHPPQATDPGDPHGKPRRAAWHNRQMVEFFRTGRIVNTCVDDGDPVCDPK